MTNTNWQAYSGETTMSYLTQMLGLAVQNFSQRRDRHHRISGPHPRPDLKVRVAGKFLGRHGTRSLLYMYYCRYLYSWPCCLAGQGVVQNFSPYKAVTTVRAIRRHCRWVPPLRRSPSNSLAPTAAVSSIPTVPIHLKTRPRFPISWKCSRYS